MIAKKYRFHGHNSLNYLYRNGRTVHGKTLAVRFVPNNHRELPRFSVIVSKKISKSAVKRNLIRRRIYEIVRHNIKPDSPAIDIAISVYSPEILSMPHAELEKQVVNLLRSAKFVVQ